MSKYLFSLSIMGFLMLGFPLTVFAEIFPQRVSVASDGIQGNSYSAHVSISADGRFVSFISNASNLVPDDTNQGIDGFVHDRLTGVTEPVAITLNGSAGGVDGHSAPSLSADGRYVAFTSGSGNLVPGDTNWAYLSDEVFVRDRVTGVIERINRTFNGGQVTQANADHVHPSISADGRYVTYSSNTSNLVLGDTNGLRDVFMFDRVAVQTIRVSIASDGSQANTGSDFPVMSADGRYVAFYSSASNLVPDDTNGTGDIFVHDRITGDTERINVAPDGSQSNGGIMIHTSPVSISPDGRYVGFSSNASNLVPNDTNITYDGYNIPDTFIHDRVTGLNERVNLASDGSQADDSGYMSAPSISADNRYVVFQSHARNLVPNDTNNADDIFIRDRVTGLTERISVAADGSQGNDYSGTFLGAPVISADGKYITFYSFASNLVFGDTNGTSDSFVTRNPFILFNQEPILSPIGNKTVDEGQSLQITITATDPDVGDTVTLSANNLPAGASFDPQTGIFNWTPGYNDAGIYTNIEFVATDNGNPMASMSEVISITVNDVNRVPVLDPIGNKTVNENQTLSFILSATDPDGDALTYSATNLPAGATFDPQTHTFSWTPTYAQAGNYENVEFTVTDDGSPMQLAVENITITVGNTNRPPVFASIGSQEMLENNALSFAVSATDPDGDIVILSASSTPIGATFDSGTGTFSWTPSLSQAGIYVVSFIATDDGLPSETSMLEVVITVGDNPTPTEQAQTLVDVVVSAPIPSALENSYLANLNKVGIFIEQGKIQPAINQLNAFIQKVEQDYAQGKITLEQRDDFVARAQQLIDVLEGN